MAAANYPNAKKVSTHLSWEELMCKDGTPYPEQWVFTRAVVLAEVFEEIREACGNTPITILSAYRTPSHNVQIGGARNSQHVQGRALDLRPPKGFSVNRFHRLILDTIVPRGKVRGLGLYLTFVHVDVRPSDRLIRWSGTGVKDDR